MIDQILTDAGFVLNKTYRETRFIRPPKETYVVYSDAVQRYGADGINLLNVHDVTFEMYQYSPDPDAEERLEAQFDLLGIEYDKQPRYFIDEEQLYQVIYEFTYREKED